MGNVLKPKATWYEGEGLLLAQWLFGHRSSSPLDRHDDLLKVAELCNKHMTQKRIVVLIDIIAKGTKAYNKKYLKKAMANTTRGRNVVKELSL